MLAPVGIGIMGALLIVGVLYSIRMIHRKRRNSFKHQRRKVRQPEVSHRPSVCPRVPAMTVLLPDGGVNLPCPFILPATSRAGDEPSGPGHAAGRQLRRRVLKRRDFRPGQKTTQRLGHNLHRGHLRPSPSQNLLVREPNASTFPSIHQPYNGFYRASVMHCRWKKYWHLLLRRINPVAGTRHC